MHASASVSRRRNGSLTKTCASGTARQNTSPRWAICSLRKTKQNSFYYSACPLPAISLGKLTLTAYAQKCSIPRMLQGRYAPSSALLVSESGLPKLFGKKSRQNALRVDLLRWYPNPESLPTVHCSNHGRPQASPQLHPRRRDRQSGIYRRRERKLRPGQPARA